MHPRANLPALRPVTSMIAALLCSLVACGGTEVLPPDTPGPAAAPLSAAALRVTATRMDDPLAGLAEKLSGPLGSDGRLLLAGLRAPPAAAPWPDSAVRRFYVDSRLGKDSNDGRSATRPWRSLARLAAATLAPGDRVELACGSTWRETLRLAASGAPSAPLVVAAPVAGCSQPPTIDGSVALAAARWQRQSAGVWRQTLSSVPLQLFSATGPWVAAHHPNRSANGPSWLTMATDGNLTHVQGQDVSTRLGTGADLVLPAAARLGTGTRVRVRTAAFVIDDLAVASTDGRALNLATPSTYPLKAGWGYLLTGQAWMVDSPGEWFHDAAAGRLLAAALGSSSSPQLPSSATVQALGIDLQDRSHVVVDGLVVRKVGTGALLRGGQGLHLRNSRFEDIADRGVDAAASQAVVLESNRLERTGLDAVFAGGIGAAAAQGLVVRNNLVRQSGVLLDGAAIRSLPRRSYAAVLAGQAATVSGNVIVDSAYIGIRVFERSVVDGNVVIGSCTVLDDCGAIYTLGADNGSRITGNVVLTARGNPGGKPQAAWAPQAQGLYLDDDASGVRVEGNTVIDTDHGIQLHDASANSITGNRLYGNRVAQLWLQETRPGALTGNTVTDNQAAPVHPQSRSLLAQTVQAEASAFGQFDRNRWFDAVPGRIGTVGTSTFSRDLSALDWFTRPGLVSAGAADAEGSVSSGHGHAGYAVSGGNLVPNGDAAGGTAGWSHWNAGTVPGQLQILGCAARPCLRYTGGAPTGLLSSPNFSLEQGRWYRLSVDMATDAEGQPVQLVVRRGGGGSNGYESLSDRSLAFTAGLQMQRHTVVFQATRSVRAGDARTADLGARVDIEGVAVGRSVSVARLEIVPVTPDAATRVSVALVNAGPTPLDLTCPLPATQAALCATLADLGGPAAGADGRRIVWPLRLPPRSSRLLHAFEDALPDRDADGIADWQDACPGSAPRRAVGADGC